jgi:hypothetical protein
MTRLLLLAHVPSGPASAAGHYLFAWTGDEKKEGNDGWTGTGKPHGVVVTR